MKKSSKRRQLRAQCWVDVDGKKFFGPGRAELLRLIHDTGSIAEAARMLGMSYKKAWFMVSEMNSKGSSPYVIAKKGGKKGGGTFVTKSGLKVLKSYDQLAHQINSIVEEKNDLLKFI